MTRQRVFGSILALVGVVAVTVTLSRLLPIGYDFYHYYWPIPRAWLEGHTRLYDETSRQFFSPPWALWMLLPFSMLPIQWGMSALTLVSMAIISGISYTYAKESGAGRPGLIAVLATVCPYSLELLFVGTLDTWSLLGIYLSYPAIQRRWPWLLGTGLLLAPIRPQDAVLTVPALILSVRHWPKRDLARAAVIPALVLLASLLVFGWDWPMRWWKSYFALPPHPYLVTSTYGAARATGIPLPLVLLMSLTLVGLVAKRIWERGISQDTLDLTVTASSVVSPYMLSQSYVVLLALPWARLAARRPWLAAIPYAISPVLLIRAQGLWDRLGLLDVTFPIILLVLLLIEPKLRRPARAAPLASREPVTGA